MFTSKEEVICIYNPRTDKWMNRSESVHDDDFCTQSYYYRWSDDVVEGYEYRNLGSVIRDIKESVGLTVDTTELLLVPTISSKLPFLRASYKPDFSKVFDMSIDSIHQNVTRHQRKHRRRPAAK